MKNTRADSHLFKWLRVKELDVTPSEPWAACAHVTCLERQGVKPVIGLHVFTCICIYTNYTWFYSSGCLQRLTSECVLGVLGSRSASSVSKLLSMRQG